MSDNFYRAFEDKYRGSRELIKSRLEIYLSFVTKLNEFDSEPKAIDLGCGRGEWLELMGEYGYQAQGIDLDVGMLEACQNRGFDVTQKDAIVALNELKDASVSIITGFHIVEHLPFEVLQVLVQEALRVLKPGGMLIMETPNPENIKIATANFYLDPTHIRPIPSQLLSFLTEHYGFGRTKILRLQESQEVHHTEPITLSQVISGVSPDYAVIAQKQASEEIMSSFNELFYREYGVSLETLANKFENRLLKIEAHTNAANSKADKAQAQASEANARAIQAEQNANEYYGMIVNSNSWKFTKPLRLIGKLMRRLLNHFPFLKTKLKRLSVKSFDYKQLDHSSTKKEILLDITHVYKHDLKTGIQRVVRSILKELSLNLNNVRLIFLTDTEGYWVYKYVDAPETIVVPKKDDIFLGLDLNAGVTEAGLAGLFDDWKLREVQINFIVYDILPILHPHWWPQGVGQAHEEWLKTVLSYSDKIFCISQTVSDDVKKYMTEYQSSMANNPSIDWFHLGADIENSAPSKGMPDDAESVLNQLTSKPSFLMVGTIEPRKGQNQTLLAFEKLWENSIDINLVIIGKQGWIVDELATKMRRHPEYNRRLFWLEGVSDEYLEKVYTASTCLIAASEGEGFGLPLIEAAQYKLPIIARDIPVFREVAGEFAYYFKNKNDPSVLAATIMEWLKLYKANNHPESDKIRWLTWQESTKKIVNLLDI